MSYAKKQAAYFAAEADFRRLEHAAIEAKLTQLEKIIFNTFKKWGFQYTHPSEGAWALRANSTKNARWHLISVDEEHATVLVIAHQANYYKVPLKHLSMGTWETAQWARKLVYELHAAQRAEEKDIALKELQHAAQWFETYAKRYEDARKTFESKGFTL